MSYGASGVGLKEIFPSGGSWGDSAFVGGDFYREPDDVCRGVTLSAADLPSPGPEAFGSYVDGDFYRSSDDTCKGISLAGLSGLEAFSPLDFGKSGFHAAVDAEYSSTVASSKHVRRTERFMEGDAPPAAPSDSFFKLEMTTLCVTSAMPFEIGNHLLDFFSNEVSSDLTKVRHAKFSIKADVFISTLMCTLKVRVYDQKSGQYAIEFQRRSGDTVAFNSAFNRAKGYLELRLGFAAKTGEVPAFPGSILSFSPMPLPAEFVEPHEGAIAPVIDLCSCHDAPLLQAEAANTLIKLVNEDNPNVYTRQIFQGVRELLQASSKEVAYPTSCLLTQLAPQPEAAPYFASEGLLLQMLEKVRTCDATTAQLRVQLACALSAATQRQSKATLPGNLAEEVINAFDSVLNDTQPQIISQEMRNHLENAVHAMKLQLHT